MVRFKTFPTSWGIVVPYGGKRVDPKERDLELLEFLREELSDEFDGKPIPIKDIEEVTGRKAKHVGARLTRLWRNGIVGKFARSFHTQSGRPNYVSYYIWSDWPQTEHKKEVPQFYV